MFLRWLLNFLRWLYVVVDVCRWFYVVQSGSTDVRRKASSVFLSTFFVWQPDCFRSETIVFFRHLFIEVVRYHSVDELMIKSRNFISLESLRADQIKELMCTAGICGYTTTTREIFFMSIVDLKTSPEIWNWHFWVSELESLSLNTRNYVFANS